MGTCRLMKEATRSAWELFEKEVKGGKELIQALGEIESNKE